MIREVKPPGDDASHKIQNGAYAEVAGVA